LAFAFAGRAGKTVGKSAVIPMTIAHFMEFPFPV